jgi:transposase
MKRLPVVAHLPPEEVGRRYRTCPDPKEKTRWQLIWLLLRPGEALSCERAAALVGLSDVYARVVLRRWNAQGPDGLADRRRHNKSPGKLTAAQLAELYDALQKEPADGGLWSGPKVAAHVRDRWGVEACPQTGWRWLRKLGFRLAVPRPRHPKAAGPEEQRRWL